MRTYTTGNVPEMIDKIALEQIGSETDLGVIYDLNPGLAAQGLEVAARTTIKLPERSFAAATTLRRLFG